jgi:hypothetical protein
LNDFSTKFVIKFLIKILMQNNLSSVKAMRDHEDICIEAVNCRFFQGEILVGEKAQEIYVRLYCRGGEQGHTRCKRLLTVKAGYNPGAKLMPNDERTVEQIIEQCGVKL